MSCVMCGSNHKVSSQVSRSQLIFGGFRGKIYEDRCEKCEKKVIESIKKMLKDK